MMAAPPWSLPMAIRQYELLCRDERSGAQNAWSALPIVIKTLRHPSMTGDVFWYVARHPNVTTAEMCPHFGVGANNVGVYLMRLLKYELIVRQRVPPHEATKYEYVYRLSPFGSMVMDLEGS